MAAVGGDLQSCTIADRIFPVVRENDPDISPGGLTPQSVEMNGDGSARVILNQEPWMVEGLEIALDPDRDDEEFLNEIQERGEPVSMTLVDVKGRARGGSGVILKPVKFKPQSSTASVDLGGGGKFVK